MVQRVADLHLERREALAEIAVREMGKPMEQALGEVDFCGDIYGYYAERAEEFLKDEPIDLLAGEGTAIIRRSAMGPADRDHALELPLLPGGSLRRPEPDRRQLDPAQAGPPVSRSPPRRSRRSTTRPDSRRAYQTILATNDQIADAIADPRVRGVSVTGSERAGAAVAEVAGRNLKKVVLEMGGSDPFILLATDDLDEAVEAAVPTRASTTPASRATPRSGSSSPTISTTTSSRSSRRRWVRPSPATRLRDPAMGPLSSDKAAERLADQLDRAIAQGAEVALKGERKENFFTPTVLTGITPDNDAYHEEFFGPVASVYKVGSEEEAVELANDTPFGLGSYVFTDDEEQAQRVADHLDTGMVFVNGTLLDGAELPFGGVKRSGFGRELGPYGMDEFVNKKLIRVLK